MRNLFKRLFITPEDLGMQKYSVHEIANKMERSDEVDESSLMEFAKTVHVLLESDKEDKNNLTIASTRTK